MKIVCTKKNLRNGLVNTSRIIGSGTTLPILNNILLKTDKGRLRLSSTNLEIAINTWVGGKIEEEGEVTVPARIISDYINNLVSDRVTISSEKQTLFIEAEKARTHINGLPTDDFPLIPRVGEQAYAKIKTKDLNKAISEVVFATAYSETQPEISGVLFLFNGKELILATTDRYRLAESKIILDKEVSEPMQIIIPTRSVNELNRIVSGDNVDMYSSHGQVMFQTENTELISRLIEGQYPDYKQIVPTNFLTEARVLREEIIQGLKASSLFSSDNNNIEIEINPQNKQLVIRSQSTQTGDSEISIGGVMIGQKNTIIFNYRYLLECLTNISDEQINLQVIDSSSPAKLTPVGRDNYMYIVMPIKI